MDPWAAYEHVQRLDHVCEIVLKSGVGVRAMNSRLASATAVESGMGMKGTSSGDHNRFIAVPMPHSARFGDPRAAPRVLAHGEADGCSRGQHRHTSAREPFASR